MWQYRGGADSRRALRFEGLVSPLIRRRLRKRLQEPEDTPECQDHVKDGTCGRQYDQGFQGFSFLGRFARGAGVSRPLRLIGMSRAEMRTLTDRPPAASSGLRLAMARVHVSTSCSLLPTNPARHQIHPCLWRNAGSFARPSRGWVGSRPACSNGATDADAMPRNQRECLGSQ